MPTTKQTSNSPTIADRPYCQRPAHSKGPRRVTTVGKIGVVQHDKFRYLCCYTCARYLDGVVGFKAVLKPLEPGERVPYRGKEDRKAQILAALVLS